MFKTNFTGQNTIWGEQKNIWDGTAPELYTVATGLLSTPQECSMLQLQSQICVSLAAIGLRSRCRRFLGGVGFLRALGVGAGCFCVRLHSGSPTESFFTSHS